ncbi:MAG: hypothetical protein O3C43_23210 [Verrucomicrobia bacterium]|nr:hypothetical protein [Verrucomicrobiota bacterium]MDA1069395.1 hypothetical protein [Verrucomicrobiota bacterium]
MKSPPLLVKLLVVCVIGVSAYTIGLIKGKAGIEATQMMGTTETSISPEETSVEVGQATTSSVSLDPASIFDLSKASDRTYLFDQYLKEMTSLNALATLARLEALRPSQKRNQMVGQFFSRWGELTGEAALQYAMNYKGTDGFLFQGSAIEGWADSQPVEAWSALMSLSNNGSIFFPRIEATIARISEKDLGLAVSLARQIAEPYAQDDVFRPIVNSAADRNQLPELLALVGEVTDANQKGRFLEALFRDWGQVDNEQSLFAANQMADEAMVASAMKGLMKGWAANDAKGALEYAIQNASDPLFGEISVSLANSWAQNANATEIESLIGLIETAENKNQILNGVIISLGRADPEKALQVVEKLDDVPTKARNTAMVLFSMARTDYDAAESYFRAIPDDEVRSGSVFNLASNAIKLGKTAAETLSLVDAFQNEKSRNSALSGITFAATQGDVFHETEELRDELYSRIESLENYNEKAKANLLKRLKPDTP